VQVAPSVLDQVKVTGTPAVTLWALAVRATARFPVPDKLMVDVLAPALMLNVAVVDPAETGLNTTLTVQLEPTATDLAQVLVCENGLGLGVDSEIPVMGSGSVPVFVTVTHIGALAVLIAWLPNASDPGNAV
jgi:hypothetical protein